MGWFLGILIGLLLFAVLVIWAAAVASARADRASARAIQQRLSGSHEHTAESAGNSDPCLSNNAPAETANNEIDILPVGHLHK